MELQKWYKSELGQAVWNEERDRLLQILLPLHRKGLFLQCGVGDKLEIENSFLLDNFDSHKAVDILVDYHYLPFFDCCIEGIYLSHILEYSNNPHQVIREVRRILIPEGILLLSFFNRIGVWGGVSLVKNEMPWKGQFFYQAKIMDWLCLLDFEIIEIHRVFNRLPINQKYLLQKMKRLEQLPWKVFSASTMIFAKKRVIPLTLNRNIDLIHSEFQNYIPEPTASKKQ